VGNNYLGWSWVCIGRSLYDVSGLGILWGNKEGNETGGELPLLNRHMNYRRMSSFCRTAAKGGCCSAKGDHTQTEHNKYAMERKMYNIHHIGLRSPPPQNLNTTHSGVSLNGCLRVLATESGRRRTRRRKRVCKGSKPNCKPYCLYVCHNNTGSSAE